MSYKSRASFKFGKCLETCECRSCRDDKSARNYSSRKFETVSTANGIVVNTHFAPDGSVMDKPLSQTYISHIRSRTKESIKKMKPNMGAYVA